MAWQNSIGMGPIGGGNVAGPGDAGQNGIQPQGTEYTLQGVMRFLQTEWHRHERDRNAWQIEREEMKRRIAKLEGDLRTNKKLRESMDKHIRMLENALKKSRNKGGNLPDQDKDQNLQTSTADKSRSSSKSRSSKLQNSFLDLEGDEISTPGLRHDTERDRSRVYMGKCIEEFAYHVFSTPNSHQQYLEEQEHLIQNNRYVNHEPPRDVSLADVYASQRQKQQQQATSDILASSSMNHHPSEIRSDLQNISREAQNMDEPAYISSIPELRQQPAQSRPVTAIDRSNQQRMGFEQGNAVDKNQNPQNFNSYGHQISHEPEDSSGAAEVAIGTEADGWNFDDAPESHGQGDEQAKGSIPISQRPDTDVFPNASDVSMKSAAHGGQELHRRRTSLSRRRQSDGAHELRDISTSNYQSSAKGDTGQFKVRFALRGHLDVVRSVIFTGGGSPSAPEVCSASDDGVIKRWIAASLPQKGDDLDLKCDQTHRGHTGAVLCLAASPAYQPFSNGGRAQGDGWVFSGGQDATLRVWERGRVDPKASLEGHTDAVWTVCVMPCSMASIFGDQVAHYGGADRTIVASGAADGTVLVWSVSSPPQVASPHTGSRRGTGGSRRANSVSSGSNFPSSPQPNTATSKPFHYTLIHRIAPRQGNPSPTSICSSSPNGESFVVSYNDASICVFDTRTGEEVVCMASQETYDGTPATGVNTVAATTIELEGAVSLERTLSEDDKGGSLHGGSAGSSSGVDGMVLSGHEDKYIRFFDANSGQCTYNMLAHPAPISSLSLSPSGNELVSAGHDASLRFWSLDKRSCTQEVTSHRLMRGEGVCSVVWSQDGRWVVSAGGDGVIKVFTRLLVDTSSSIPSPGQSVPVAAVPAPVTTPASAIPTSVAASRRREGESGTTHVATPAIDPSEGGGSSWRF